MGRCTSVGSEPGLRRLRVGDPGPVVGRSELVARAPFRLLRRFPSDLPSYPPRGCGFSHIVPTTETTRRRSLRSFVGLARQTTIVQTQRQEMGVVEDEQKARSRT